MKKITLLFLMLFGAIGFAQHPTLKANVAVGADSQGLGINNPIFTNDRGDRSSVPATQEVGENAPQYLFMGLTDREEILTDETYRAKRPSGMKSPNGGEAGICATPVIEVNQDVDDTCMAFIAPGIAQSFIPLETEAAGAGIKFRDPSTGLNVDISLWDDLPNAGGVMLTSGTTDTDGTNWADVLWDDVVTVTVGDTYYIVIEGDPTLPCLSGSLNDPYPDGMTYANGFASFPTYDYTFRTFSCDSGGGGVACSQDNPENAFENGLTTSKDGLQVIATDINVPADTDFSLEKMTVHIWMNPGETLTSADITFYDNGADIPGAVRSTNLAVVPVSQTVIGSNFGYDISEVVFEIAPEMLPGTAGSISRYWVSLYIDVSSGSGFIGVTTATIEGVPNAFSPDAGATWNVNAGNDTVYIFEGECEAIGGGITNDECIGAIAVSCGDSISGTTVLATIDSGAPTCGPSISSPGVWYSFDDNSGVAGDITVSLCNADTTFDTKLSIYSGTCSALVCVDGDDDFCGLQSEVTFASDGNTKYYILVHSFGGATGTFTLDVTCSTIGISENTFEGFSYYPNPTSDILNLKSIDVIEKVSLYNLLGQRVIDTRINATTSQVDVSGLSNGSYMMKVTVNGQTATYKVLKQ